MSTATFPHRLVAELLADQREIIGRELPTLASALWDLELRFGADDEDFGRVRGDLDELQADVAIHLGEEREFLMPLVERLAGGEQLPVEVLDQVGAVIARLSRRHDDFDGEIAAIRERLLEAPLPPEAEDDRSAILDRLELLLAHLRRHDRAELETLFPATLAEVHDQLVDRDREEDEAHGWS